MLHIAYHKHEAASVYVAVHCLHKLPLHVVGNWGGLTHLDLSENLFQDQGAAALGTVSWTNLQVLNLSQNRLGARGFWALSRARLPLLANLDVQDTNGLAVFTDALVSASWPKLMHLNVAGCGVLHDASYLVTLITGRWCSPATS